MVCDIEQSHRNLQLQKRFDTSLHFDASHAGEAALLYWTKFSLADLMVVCVCVCVCVCSLACLGIRVNQSSASSIRSEINQSSLLIQA